MKLSRLFAALSLAACASACAEDETLKDQLQGGWVAVVGDDYARGWTFEGDGIERKDILLLDDGSLGMEIHTGRFTLQGNRLSWTWLSTSCEEYAIDDTVKVVVRGDTLQMTSLDGSWLLDRPEDVESDTPGVAFRFGCVHNDGTFEARSVKKL